MTPEHRIQNEIRNALAGRCLLFRANVGQAWVGVRDEEAEERLGRGTVVLRNARRFSTGLPDGFADLFGVTPDGRFLAIEVKAPKGKVSEAQENFRTAILRMGGRAGVARSVQDALAILAQE